MDVGQMGRGQDRGVAMMGAWPWQGVVKLGDNWGMVGGSQIMILYNLRES